jgi:cell division protein FtsI (penicillin-binding protein 3)
MLVLGQQFRSQVVFAGICLASLLLLARLFDLQCLRFETYRTRALQQQKRVHVVPARRGRILDRHGNIFAISTTKPAVWSDPGLVTDARAEALVLAKQLGLKVQDVYRKLADPSDRFVWITKDVSDAQTMQLRAAMKRKELPGVYIKEETERLYPKGALLGNVIGFCNAEGDGAEGLEYQADDLLAGHDGYMITRRDNRRRYFIDPNWLGKPLEPQDGQDIYLTIDEYIQTVAERELLKAVEEYKPSNAFAIVMEPSTGQILALALWPRFNPNVRTNYVPGMLQNQATAFIFEPGSTMKSISGAIALSEGVVNLGSRVYCEQGAWRATAGHTLRDDHELGEVSFKEVIQYSSNIGMAKVAGQLDPYIFWKHLIRFGFGQRTGITLVPSESAGILRPPSQWSKLSMVSLPIGHEIGVTGLQLLTAVATIANKGTRVQPTLLKRIETSAGELSPEGKRFNYFERVVLDRNVITKEAAEMITEAMQSVTTREGTGALADIPGYSVAGKTGTAQKFVNGAYSHRQFTASFVGFVPATRPAICAAVVFDTPSRKYYGGLVAAPVFKRICEETLAYLKVAKDVSHEALDGGAAL